MIVTARFSASFSGLFTIRCQRDSIQGDDLADHTLTSRIVLEFIRFGVINE